MNRPIILLLITGMALGFNFPLGKLAIAAGIDPLLWACFISLGAGFIMMALSKAWRSTGKQRAPLLRFSVLSGFLSYVVPNALTYLLIPRIGAGLVAIMFALSPVFTALLSLLLRVRPPNAVGLAGIGLGLVGALVIVFGRSSVQVGEAQVWLLLALLIPVFLGFGNVYRTMAWPTGAEPRTLASTTNLAAVLPLAALGLWHAGGLPLAALAQQPALLAMQLASSTLMFMTFFRLQQVGGPTYLSQIGYVAAAVGLLIGTVFMGERYPLSVWAGAAVIAAGVGLSTLGQMRRTSP